MSKNFHWISLNMLWMNAFITELRVTLRYFNTVPIMSEIMLSTSSSYCKIQLNFIECNITCNFYRRGFNGSKSFFVWKIWTADCILWNKFELQIQKNRKIRLILIFWTWNIFPFFVIDIIPKCMQYPCSNSI